MYWIRRSIWLTAVIVLTYGVYAFLPTLRAAPPNAALKTATVQLGNLESFITAQGKLEPQIYVTVGAQITGQIKKIYVSVGDTVKQGQLLAELDPRLYQSKVAQDEADVQVTMAQIAEQDAVLQLAKQQAQRNNALYAQEAISADVRDQSNAALQQAIAKKKSLQAQLNRAQSQLAADRTNLAYTKIVAPIDGVVASLPVREGQTINASQNAPTLMEIDNLDTMRVRAQVAEADINRISLNMPASFTTLGDSERKWHGVVKQIQGVPEIINDVVLYNVLIDVKNQDNKLMNGMSTQVFFQMAQAQNVPLLPVEALGKRLRQHDSEAGKAYAVHVQGEPEPRTVFVGMSDRVQAQINQGLSVGDVVLLPERPKMSGNKP